MPAILNRSVPGVPNAEMTGYLRVPGVPKAEMSEYSLLIVPGVPKAEMSEYSRVPGVPKAEMTDTAFYGSRKLRKKLKFANFFRNFPHVMYALYGSKKLRKKFGNFHFRQ